MSFQSFSKVPPPPRHRPKNLPTIQFINLLQALCLDTPNEYDLKNHVLVISRMEAFEQALRQKANRSLHSFEKQLKILGFRKFRDVGDEYKMDQNGDEEEKIVIKYYWKGRKEEYLNKELGHIEKHLNQFIGKASQFREVLIDCKQKLDKNFENSLFSGLGKGVQHESTQLQMKKCTKMVKQVINWSHKTSGELVRDVQLNLEDEISLLRLLTFKHSQLFDE